MNPIAEHEIREIDGKGKTVRELLANRKYAIDYYQREFKWQTKQVSELLDDLASKFLESHEESNERRDVARYAHYFLGSVIVSKRDGRNYIIDGQQRLTTLTLLLIFLKHQLEDPDHQGLIANLIFSQQHGVKSFNMDVSERNACMEALYEDEQYISSEESESVDNILGRYSDIGELFPEELSGNALPFFVDWLIENVHLVEITAYSDNDAYTIFETMNDRGLSLTATDMLKGYLLANVTNEALRVEASESWKSTISTLSEIGKEEDADGIKSWLRAKHSNSIRERKRGALPGDFDRIGTEFHRWVRDNKERLELENSSDFARFIQRDLAFYGKLYEKLRRAAQEMTPGLECVFYNAQHNFTLQYPVLLAPLNMADSEDEIERKLRIVATYIDIKICRRLWNWKAIDYSTMQYRMFTEMKDLRGLGCADLAEKVSKMLSDDEVTFEANERFYLTKMNGPQVHRLLARMTEFVETSSGKESRYVEYSKRGKGGYEIEHIWPNHFERYSHEFDHQNDFDLYRNRIGGLVLLPKSQNASLGDKDYAEKREIYQRYNYLAASLHEGAYQSEPRFKRFIEDSEIPFRPMQEFRKQELDERQELYRQLAMRVWTPDRIERELEL